MLKSSISSLGVKFRFCSLQRCNKAEKKPHHYKDSTQDILTLTNKGQGHRQVIRHCSANLRRLLEVFVETRELHPLPFLLLLVHLLLWRPAAIFFILYKKNFLFENDNLRIH